MRLTAKSSNWKLLGLLVVVFAVGACAASGPYYTASETPSAPPPPPATSVAPPPASTGFAVGHNEFNYSFDLFDRTPFNIIDLPRSLDILYRKGYDEVRQRGEADLAVTVTLSAGAAENPEKRVGHAVGGALGGAAIGAIIGGALGDPGTGAALGAASGGAAGALAPAADYMVRIDVEVYSRELGRSSYESRTINVSRVPPPAVPGVVDQEVSAIFRSLPDR